MGVCLCLSVSVSEPVRHKAPIFQPDPFLSHEVKLPDRLWFLHHDLSGWLPNPPDTDVIISWTWATMHAPPAVTSFQGSLTFLAEKPHANMLMLQVLRGQNRAIPKYKHFPYRLATAQAASLPHASTSATHCDCSCWLEEILTYKNLSICFVKSGERQTRRATKLNRTSHWHQRKSDLHRTAQTGRKQKTFLNAHPRRPAKISVKYKGESVLEHHVKTKMHQSFVLSKRKSTHCHSTNLWLKQNFK